MCQYNFLVLENNSMESEISEAAKASEFRFQDVMTNFSIPKLYAFVTDLGLDNCNCGSVIGNCEWKEEEKFDIEKEKKKLQRKKFSKNRIEQLLHDKQQHLELEKTRAEIKETKEAEKWINFLNKLKSRRFNSRVGLLFHNYRIQIAEEYVKIEEEILDVENIDAETLKNMIENKLYWIKL